MKASNWVEIKQIIFIISNELHHIWWRYYYLCREGIELYHMFSQNFFQILPFNLKIWLWKQNMVFSQNNLPSHTHNCSWVNRNYFQIRWNWVKRDECHLLHIFWLIIKTPKLILLQKIYRYTVVRIIIIIFRNGSFSCNFTEFLGLCTKHSF